MADNTKDNWDDSIKVNKNNVKKNWTSMIGN